MLRLAAERVVSMALRHVSSLRMQATIARVASALDWTAEREPDRFYQSPPAPARRRRGGFLFRMRGRQRLEPILRRRGDMNGDLCLDGWAMPLLVQGLLGG